MTVVGNSSSLVFEELGSADTDAAVWNDFSANISDFAGQTVHLLIAAADGGSGSLVEAGIDDVVIRTN